MSAHRLAPAFLFGALTMTASGSLRAQGPVPDGRIESGALSFDGHSSVADFTGRTTTITGAMTGGAELSAVRGWVEAPVLTLKTGNGRRDTDLNKSMESEKYPTIRYELDSVALRGVRGDTTDVTLAGRFLIHGVMREAAFPARVIRDGGRIRVQAKTPLNLKDYQIGGLTKMLGLLRMNELIVVHVDLVFTAGPGSEPAPGAGPTVRGGGK